MNPSCQAKTPDGEPCPERAAWLYHLSAGGVMPVCAAHVERLKARLGDRLVESRLKPMRREGGI